MTTCEMSIMAASRLRRLAFNPIASDPIVGHPTFPYSSARDRGLSAKSFERLAKAGSTNLQVACGVPWGLAVIDIDGLEGMQVWQWWKDARNIPDTWTVETPRNGRQLWFNPPATLRAVPTRHLWRSEDVGHEGIEILGEGRLAKSPPSWKMVDGQPKHYRWLAGHEPGAIPMATLPLWLIPPKRAISVSRRTETPIARPDRFKNSASWRDVRDAISDKTSLAQSWGLRVMGSANQAGWMRCRSAEREDKNPSAMFSPSTGRYWDAVMGRLPMSIFDLGVLLGVYVDFPTAVNHLASTYIRRAS